MLQITTTAMKLINVVDLIVLVVMFTHLKK